MCMWLSQEMISQLIMVKVYSVIREHYILHTMYFVSLILSKCEKWAAHVDFKPLDRL